VDRSAQAACVAGALAAVAALSISPGCDGELIHLGNGQTTFDGGVCAHAQVPASQVLWIGDSWVIVPGNQHTGVRDLARSAGAIGPNDDYTIAAAAAATMADVAAQYTAQEAGATKVKVLIMDGGTWDTIQSNGSAASVSSVVATFTQLLATVASDGTVTDVIYFLVPEASGVAGVADLRSPLSLACTQSAVPCHFLDLQQPWNGHPEYDTGGAIPVPTAAGGTVIADAIWGLMQAACIAQ
jgi:hypothetical protein